MEKRNIQVPFPTNLPEKDQYLFDGLSYEIEKRAVDIEKNVFVSKSGVCLRKLRLVKASVHRECRQYFFTFYKLALGSFVLNKHKKLSGETYLLIHNTWSRGYYHWICEALPRLWQVKDEAKNYILLLPETYKGYQLQTLKCFSFKSIQYFPPNTGFVIDKLVVPSNPDQLYEMDPEICGSIRQFFLSQLNAGLAHQINLGERIYVSRKRTKRRIVVNEDVLEETLREFGFRIISFEDYNFWEQVAIMSRARYLISIHGAGLTNMQFMKPGGKVLELYKKRIPKVDFGKGRETDMPSPCYCRLASVLGHQHYIQFCEAVDGRVPSGNADLVVDKSDFEKNIRLMLTSAISFSEA